MVDGNDFDRVRGFDEEVLKEIIREGELRVEAQLAVATAADLRALTLAGFQITVATGALGGAIALHLSHNTLLLAMIAAVFGLLMIVGAWMSIETVRPADFVLPGNNPAQWLPEKWAAHAKGLPMDIGQARVEQIDCLHQAVRDNKAVADQRGIILLRSLNLTLFATSAGAVAMILTLLWYAAPSAT